MSTTGEVGEIVIFAMETARVPVTEVLAAFFTMHCRVIDVPVPAVNVAVGVVPFAVMLPPPMVLQVYVHPGWVGTEAVRPV
jgi:hypothetical protein